MQRPQCIMENGFSLATIEEDSVDEFNDSIRIECSSTSTGDSSSPDPRAMMTPKTQRWYMFKEDAMRSVQKASLQAIPRKKSSAGSMFRGKSKLRPKISFRTTALAIARFRRSLVIFDKRDMCLCGLLNLSLSVHLICCIEVFFSMVLLMQSPDLITMDGTYFYFLGLFDGWGKILFAVHLIASVSCVTTACLLYVGSRLRRPEYLLPHLIWQISFILLAVIASIVMIKLGIEGKMLLPSSIVLSAMLLIPGIGEFWWSYLTLSYYRQMKLKKTRHSDGNEELCDKEATLC